MAITWGSMNGPEAIENARLEQSCHAQAKAEIEAEGQATSGYDFIVRSIRRAQEIKLRARR
jgi:hypothetical protein